MWLAYVILSHTHLKPMLDDILFSIILSKISSNTQLIVHGHFMTFHFAYLLIFLCACAPQTQEQSQTHLRVMAEPWMFQKYPLREAKERFEKNHPGVQIELQKAPEGYPNRLLVAMMSHRSDTDLFFGTVENTVAIWAARDLLLPWNAYIQSHPNLQRDAFIPTFYDMNLLGGKQYALPITAELFCFCINKEMAAQAGLLDTNGNILPAQTWNDVFDYARRMTQRDPNGHVTTVGLAANWSWPNNMLYATIKAQRGTLIDPQKGELNLNLPEVRDLLTLTRQGAQEGITTLASMTDVNQPRSDLKARLVAMILTTHSRYLEAWETLGPNSTTIMPIPGKNGGVTGGTRSVVIPKNSRAIHLAQQFVQEELVAPYFSRFAWEKYGKLPCMRNVFETLTEPEAHQLAQWAAASQPDPMFRDELPLTDAIKRHVQRYLTGQVELDPMLAQLQADLKTLNLSDIREHFQP
jgi:multiple sugar transport system substrate-binding protein